MYAAALALVLVWDPYPPPGSPLADGVRCYYRGQLDWIAYGTVPNAGPCDPMLIIDAATFKGAHRFVVRGYTGTIGTPNYVESPNSNEWLLCAFAVESVPPPANHATDGRCVVYSWSVDGTEFHDRSELAACWGSP